MLKNMFTHPLHVMLRGMLTHPLHNSDPEINNVITMLRGMITHPDSVGYGDDGGADDGADGAVKHLVHLAQVADCPLHVLLRYMPTPKSDHILFDEKKALIKLSCVKQTKRVVGKRYFFVAV